MTKSLPTKPSLEHLKNEAKALLKAHKAGDESACAVLKHLKKLAKKSNEEILATELPLQESQHALAMEYGFGSWAELKRSVEKVQEGVSLPEEQRNEATVRAYSEAVERGDIDRINELVTPDCMIHYDEDTKTHDEVIRDHMEGFKQRKEERHVINDVVANGNKVSVRMTSYYTQADGRVLKQHYSAIHRFVDARIAESWHDLRNMTETGVTEDATATESTTLVQSIIEEAVRTGASDIHLDWVGDTVRSQRRIDGELQATKTSIPRDAGQALIDRFKEMACLDTAIRAKSQTGRCMGDIGEKGIDMRIQVVPYVAGESVVIRVSPKGEFVLSLDQQGFSTEELERLRQWYESPNGIIVHSAFSRKGEVLWTRGKLFNLYEQSYE